MADILVNCKTEPRTYFEVSLVCVGAHREIDFIHAQKKLIGFGMTSPLSDDVVIRVGDLAIPASDEKPQKIVRFTRNNVQFNAGNAGVEIVGWEQFLLLNVKTEERKIHVE